MVTILKFRKSNILLSLLFTKIALGNHSPSKNEVANHRIATWGSEFAVASDWPVLVLGHRSQSTLFVRICCTTNKKMRYIFGYRVEKNAIYIWISSGKNMQYIFTAIA